MKYLKKTSAMRWGGIVCLCLLILNAFSQEKNASGSSKILFASFKITNDTVVLIESIVTDGSFKKNSEIKEHNETSHFLEYVLLDHHNKVISEGLVTHPLHFHAEYPNDNNGMTTKEISLTEAEFFIREEYKNAPEYIQFYDKKTNRYNTVNLFKP